MFLKFFQSRKNIILATLLLAFFAFPKNVFAENLFSVGSGASVLTATSSAIFANISNTSPASTFMLMLQKAGNELFKVDTLGNVTLQGTLTMPNSSLLTSVSAANISSGEFGKLTGGGNYIFANTVPGNVGIGLAIPSEKLHVAGNVKATKFVGGGAGVTGKFSASGIDVDALGEEIVFLGGSTGGWTNRGPSGHNGGAVLHIPTHPGGYYSELWFDTAYNRVYSRVVNAGAIEEWALLPKVSTSTSNYVPKWSGIDSMTNSNIYDNGTNVGIGFTAPNSKLFIAANHSGTAEQKVLALSNRNDSNTRTWDFSVGHSDLTYGYYPLKITQNTDIYTGDLILSPGRNTIINSSFVGINTTSPQSTLDVNGLIKMRNPDITQPEDVITKGYLDSIVTPSSSPSVGTQFGFWTAGSSNNIYNNNSGNIGIGTTKPIFKSQISGNLNVGDGTFILSSGAESEKYYDNNPGIHFHSPAAMIRKDSSVTTLQYTPSALVLYNNDPTLGAWSKLALSQRESASGNPVAIAGIAAQSTELTTGAWGVGDLILWTKNKAKQDEQVRIVGASGNVGIGTATPSQKLDVAGNIYASGDFLATGNYGTGLVGLYSATRYQNVFAMGAAYRLPANGTTPGNLYGIAWTHSNMAGQSKGGLGHQALFMTNGITQTAIGTGIWTLGGYTQSGSTANYFSGNVGIGTPTPSVRLDLGGGTAGRITGLDTAPAAVRGDSEAVPKKWIVDNFASAIGIRKSFNFTNTNNVQYYLIARLPAENSNYAEGLMIETTGHTSSIQGKGKLTVSLGQRSGFWYTKNYENNPRVHVVVYKNVDGTSNVYVYTPAANYTSGDVLYYQFGWKSGFVLYDDPVASTTVPSGTLIFDSNDDVTYPVNDSLMTGKGIFLNNVGIGTLSPSVRLDLGGGTLGRITGLDTAPAAVRGDSEAVPKKWIVDNFAPSSIVGSASLWATSTAGIYNVGLGNVGIGITNPGEKLKIEGSLAVGSTGRQLLMRADTSDVSIAGQTDSLGNSTAGVAASKWFISGYGHEFQTSPSTAVGVARTWTDRLVIAGAAGNEGDIGLGGTITNNIDFTGASMVIKSGNIGIGTTAPVSALNIVGTTDISWIDGTSYGLVTVGSRGVGGSSFFLNTPSVASAASGLGLKGTYAAAISTININAYGVKYAGYGSNLAFSTSNGTTLSEAMRIDKNGNVGVGTTTPSSKLHVVGTSYLNGTLNVTGNATFSGNTNSFYQVNSPYSTLSVGRGTTQRFAMTVDDMTGTMTSYQQDELTGDHSWVFNIVSPTTGLQNYYFRNNGSNLLTLTKNGNVGIGTIAPSVRLDLGGGTAGRITGLDTAPAAVRGDSEAVPKKWIVDNFAPAIGGASLWATSTSGIYNVGLGNIGIGTSKPGAKLEVLHVNTSTDPDTSNYPLKLYNNTWTGNQVTGIEFWNGSSKVVPTSRIVSRMNGSGNGGENLYLQTQSSSLTNPNPNQPTTKLTILADGNVGMGTQNPSVRLDLGGGAAGRITGLDTSPAAVRGDSEAVPKKWIVDNFAPSSIVGSASLWATSTSGTYNVGLVNVGIGTTNPTAKLHVNGTSIFSDSAYIPKIGSPTLYTGSAKVDLGYFTMIGGQRREIRITAGETGSDVINGVFKIRVVGDTGSVATRSYIEKTIYISTYVSPGRIYGQRSYISDAMQSDDFRISNFIYDSGTNEIVLSVWYMGSGSRGADISFDYLGKNSSSFLNATVSNLITYTPGEEPAREIVSIAPDTNFFIHNNVGIGTTAPSVRLDLGGGAAGRITGLDTSPAAVRGDSEAVPKKWIVDNFSPIAGPGAALTGSGTANYVPLWTGTGSLGTSTIYQNGGNVGIGITSPSQALDIFGKLKLTSGGVIFNANSQYRLDLAAVYTNSLLTPGGAGIGTTNPLGMVGVLQGMSNYNTAFTAPHLALTAGSAVDNTGFVGITYGASTSANYGWSSGALRSTNGQSDFVWKYHDNNAVGIERLRITKEGFVGIGTSTPSVMLDVAGAAKIGGDLNMSGKDITNVNKLTVATIDPLYRINGVNYSSFAASLVGGVKEEYLGRVKISKRNSAKEYEYRLDFSKIEKGSDLWVWRQTVDFSPENVEVSITPYGAFANTYYFVENNAIILRADKAVDVSYRLSGKRHDWQAWPTRANDQLESPSFIINNGKVIK